MGLWPGGNCGQGTDGNPSSVTTTSRSESRREDGGTFEWETTARSWDAAHRAMYDYRGWGICQPLLQEDGTPFPLDEGNDDNPIG